MSHITTKILPDNHMPRRPVLLIEIFLHARRDVLLDVVLLQGGGRDFDRVRCHLLRHIRVFDDRLLARLGVACARRCLRGVYGVVLAMRCGLARVVDASDDEIFDWLTLSTMPGPGFDMIYLRPIN
jgi:hypothetical protein